MRASGSSWVTWPRSNGVTTRAQGAKDNLARQGMRVVSEGKYPLSTTDFTRYKEEACRPRPGGRRLAVFVLASIAARPEFQQFQLSGARVLSSHEMLADRIS